MIKQSIIVAVMLLGSTQGNAISVEKLEQLEADVKNLNETLNHYYAIISENTPKNNVYATLDKYPSAETRVVGKWLSIASQSFRNPNIKLFVEDTKGKARTYLEKILLRDKNPMSIKDFNTIKKSIEYVQSEEKYQKLNEPYQTITGVNLRTLPILEEITKRKILKQNTKFNVLYTFSYQTSRNRTTQWAYIDLKSGEGRGWVNMKNISKLD